MRLRPHAVAAAFAQVEAPTGTPGCLQQSGPAVDEPAQTFCGLPMKWVSLAALTFQTSWQVVVIKFARAGGGQYLNTSIVFFAEVLKTLISFALLVRAEGSFARAFSVVRLQFTSNPVGAMQFAAPALAYTVMNNLVFVSLDRLPAAVQQVTYQLKILAAAALAVAMLGKRINPVQWASLVLLVIGVSLVQWPRDSNGALVHVSRPSGAAAAPENSGWPLDADAVVGLLAVLTAAFMGGFAGVYMEMVLKQRGTSIWLRNVQLGLFGSVIGLLAAFANDGERIREGGFLQGYSWRTGIAIFTLATGGLLVAVVIKYADNILRQFSTALSISLTSIVSAVVLQEFTPDKFFFLGASMTIASTFLYNTGLPQFLKERSRPQ